MSDETGSRERQEGRRDSGERYGRDREGRDNREGRGDGRDARGRRRFRGRGRRKVCRFCADKALRIDYKWWDILEDFVSERGRIVPSRTTGTCAKHQRRLQSAIKQARNVALLPYSRR
jgi:small subunit ribosomal protein S18